MMGKQVDTERGLIYVADVFASESEAKENGYTYAWHSGRLGRDLYSKCLDDEGRRHSFAVVERKEDAD